VWVVWQWSFSDVINTKWHHPRGFIIAGMSCLAAQQDVGLHVSNDTTLGDDVPVKDDCL